MNTDRDNFHDWARDKEDTSFDTIAGRSRRSDADYEPVRWGRLALMAVLGVALVVGFKLLAGL